MSFLKNLMHQGRYLVLCFLGCLSSPYTAADSNTRIDKVVIGDRFKTVIAAPEVKRFVERILITQNHQSLPFVVLDKTHPEVFVFDAKGQLKGSAPALIGLAVGDDSVPDIGQRKLSNIQMAEKTTPAGRFVASLDLNLSGHQILWVDYETALSMHPVITSDLKEHRAERLASSSSEDKRISFGCINVTEAFFQKVVLPTFKSTYGIVYILPDSHAIQDVFSFYEP
jgi:hypothetical protein